MSFHPMSPKDKVYRGMGKESNWDALHHMVGKISMTVSITVHDILLTLSLSKIFLLWIKPNTLPTFYHGPKTVHGLAIVYL